MDYKIGDKVVYPNHGVGIVEQIKTSLTKAGGGALVKAVYETKVNLGSTLLTDMHHRQTPVFLMQRIVDAGVTLKSEAIFQEQIGHPIESVDIPATENTTGIYAGAIVIAFICAYRRCRKSDRRQHNEKWHPTPWRASLLPRNLPPARGSDLGFPTASQGASPAMLTEASIGCDRQKSTDSSPCWVTSFVMPAGSRLAGAIKEQATRRPNFNPSAQRSDYHDHESE